MNLENVQAVKERIQEIRRRYVDISERFEPRTSPSQAGFSSVLQNARQSQSIAACPADLDQVIADAANRHGIDAAVIKAVINTESGFKTNATSSVGAQGLMQLMPGTARALGVDPSDPVQNIDGGTKYLKQQLDRFGSLDLALAAYNAGPGSVVKYGGVPPYSETQNYVKKVLDSVDTYSEQ